MPGPLNDFYQEKLVLSWVIFSKDWFFSPLLYIGEGTKDLFVIRGFFFGGGHYLIKNNMETYYKNFAYSLSLSH